MFSSRVVTGVSRCSSRFLRVQSINFERWRSAGNFKRPPKNIVRPDAVAGVRERLQKFEDPLPAGEWKKLREELQQVSKYINEVNIDATLVGLCNPDTQLRVAQSYVDFLQSEGKTPNYATIGRILRMYYPAYKKGELTEQDLKDIIDIYHRLRKEHEVLDQTTCENLIAALIVTPEWRESLQLLDMIKLIAQPSVYAYSSIIAKAFQDHADMELGWKLLHEMCEIGKQPTCEIFIQYFETIRSDPRAFVMNLDKILQFIGDYNLVVSKIVISKLREVANNLGLNASITKIAKNGQCSNCKQYQPNISTSAKEFLQLSASFMDKVLIRKDVFLKSSPEEVDRFLRFIDRTAPFDFVIDGLNVAFSSGPRKPNVCAKTLASVVKYFKEMGKSILVLGRQHMSKWPQAQMNYIKQNASLFLTSDLSQDDPFLLYAAIKSGPKADFVSRDLMRTHAHLLGPELKLLFRRWQQEHQHMVIAVNDHGKVLIKSPTKYNLTACKINSTWHIPFKDEYTTMPGLSFEVPESWLCLSTSQ